MPCQQGHSHNHAHELPVPAAQDPRVPGRAQRRPPELPFSLGEDFLWALREVGMHPLPARAQATTIRALFEALAWARVIRFDPFFMIDIQATLHTPPTPQASR